MNILLTQVLTQVSKPGSLRSRMQTLAHNISTRYMGRESSCTAETASVFFILRDLMTFFDQYHAGHYTEALNVRVFADVYHVNKRKKKLGHLS